MANDLLTRLLLNSTQFDNGIQKSSRELYKMRQQAESVSKGIKTAFTGMAGVIGIGFTAMQTFNKVIESSQTLTDSLGRTTDSVSSSVDYFFSSLTGDFSHFLGGLQNVIKSAKEAYNAIDDLGTYNIYNNPELSKLEYQKNVQKTILKDKNSSPEQLKQAQQELNNLQERQLAILDERAKKESDIYEKELRLMLQKSGSLKGLTSEQADAVVKEAMSFEYYQKQTEELEKQKILRDSLIEISNNLVTGEPIFKILDEKKYKEAERQIKTISSYLEISDKSLQKVADASTQYWKTKSEIEQIKQQDNKLLGSAGGTGKGIIPEINEKDLINDIWNILSNAKPKLLIQPIIEEEETEDVIGNLINQQQEEYFSRIEKMQESIATVNELSGMFTQLGGIMAQSGNEWGAYVSNVLSSIGQLITQFIALGIAKESIGVGGIFKAIAGAGALIACISNIPKFETGGIVGGSSYSGDNILARVNSSEMILNKGQQANLFNMINAGSGGTGNNQVEFTIKGDKLVGVLNNYNKKNRF